MNTYFDYCLIIQTFLFNQCLKYDHQAFDELLFVHLSILVLYCIIWFDH